jgi:hypothetical protein
VGQCLAALSFDHTLNGCTGLIRFCHDFGHRSRLHKSLRGLDFVCNKKSLVYSFFVLSMGCHLKHRWRNTPMSTTNETLTADEAKDTWHVLVIREWRSTRPMVLPLKRYLPPRPRLKLPLRNAGRKGRFTLAACVRPTTPSNHLGTSNG